MFWTELISEDATNVDWRYWPTISRISDDNDALSRFMWPQGFMSAYHSPRRNEISSLFRNPFTKRAARGHLRFVKRKFISTSVLKMVSFDLSKYLHSYSIIFSLNFKSVSQLH